MAWLAFWPAPARFGADAWLEAPFAWLVEPPLPKLHTRTGSDAFLAPICHAELESLGQLRSERFLSECLDTESAAAAGAARLGLPCTLGRGGLVRSGRGRGNAVRLRHVAAGAVATDPDRTGLVAERA